ncbi:unnamed protein product [Bemisia tabaci]|uniref:Arf-GAP domain-containing protein n=2 Tax=Bemisia tabaci TaxID=7038 RepID=A0A9N9ZYU9_BEMTA|nr:unnamed protein product [Bemisia tabaci]
MTSLKTRNCADCGSLDPPWALINRGLLVCNECCSIHRSLGRHISQIRSINNSTWAATQLAMVTTLAYSSVNSFWEHSLSDPKSSRKKPQPRDPLHPNKEDFIRAKYQQLMFVLRSSDDIEDLNQQLHSSVRTMNLETSLRLLAQGANPNYFHQEKGSRPLHVASKAGQVYQCELLIVYGADPTAMDSQGNTPIMCARMAGHRDLADRLTECVYEVVDRLSFFLTSQKPDHKQGQHFVFPDISDGIIVPPELTKNARQKLQQLPNKQFEDLVMDVYDEIDRRETEAIWLSSLVSLEHEKQKQAASVPFLPVNPELSTMRNQGRQKLARFNGREFISLVIDVLLDAKRRQSPRENLSIKPLKRKQDWSDDEPLYDSVASDEDYVTAEQLAALIAANAQPPKRTVSNGTNDSITLEENNSSIIDSSNSLENSINSSNNHAPVSTQMTQTSNYCLELEGELKTRLTTSELKISELLNEVRRLRDMMENVTRENVELRNAINQHNFMEGVHQRVARDDANPPVEPKSPIYSSPPFQRPVSMYEAQLSKNQLIESMPHSEEVVSRTDQVTKRIQELWQSVQGAGPNISAVPCAERIRIAVNELTSIFPMNPSDEIVKATLKDLNTNTIKLQAECAALENNSERIRCCAFNMAKATRQLLTRFQ